MIHQRSAFRSAVTIQGFDPGKLSRMIRLGVKSLWLHGLRSSLTVLGIVFGVSSVIAMLAIGEGASFEAQEQIKNLGSQNIILKSAKPPEEKKVSSGGNQSFILQYGLTYKDIQAVRNTIPGVGIMVPSRIMKEYVWNSSRRVDCDVVATVPWYPEMRGHRVASGRFFTDLEMDNASAVCVIGTELVRVLFPFDSPLGRDLRFGNGYYRVIGVMSPLVKKAKEEEGTGADKSAANQVFIPLETAKIRFGEILIKDRSGSFEAERVQLHEVTIKVSAPEKVLQTAEAIKGVLERNHQKKDYEMVVPLELLKRAERTKQIFNIVLGSIAAISLLVGGIGIMNIMLATVTERTREIGIRRALGAKRSDIVAQFLVEAVILSGAGGILGVLLGMAIPYAVTSFAGLKTIITFWSPPVAFGISAVVGVVFGLYPALRAADMHPVEALRHE